MSTDPKIVTLHDVAPDTEFDEHWIQENLDFGCRHVAHHMPARFVDATVTDETVRQWVVDLVTRAAVRPSPRISIQHGESLLLLGRVGRGKTHQAYGALRALSVSGALAAWKFACAADIYAQLRPRPKVDSEELFRTYLDAPVLVVDDLGAAKNSEWTEEINYRLINHRYENALPTIVTSNVAPARMAEEFGDRVASRLAEMTRRVVLGGDDRRRVPATTPAISGKDAQ